MKSLISRAHSSETGPTDAGQLERISVLSIQPAEEPGPATIGDYILPPRLLRYLASEDPQDNNRIRSLSYTVDPDTTTVTDDVLLLSLPSDLWSEEAREDKRIRFLQCAVESDAATVADDILLLDILNDLWSVPEEASAEGFPIPPERMLSSVAHLLRTMFDILPWRFEVYPNEDHEIEIDVPNLRGSSVVISCDSKGGALCTVNILGNHRNKWYDSIVSLPDNFLREALIELTA